jgi:type I restriction enzyme S subunit
VRIRVIRAIRVQSECICVHQRSSAVNISDGAGGGAMSNLWPLMKLKDLLKPVYRVEQVDPVKEYKLLGIRLDGFGPFLREIKLGSQISATKISRVQIGDFIYSRLFAWRGAFGVINKDLDGCYVSNEFPTFEVDAEKMDVKFLRLWFRLPAVIKIVEADCSGSTPLTRNRFKEEFFLDLQIPLPPLAHQRRIISRIEELAAKIEEAGGLKRKAGDEAVALLKSSLTAIVNEHIKQNGTLQLNDLIIDACYGTSIKCGYERVKDSIPVLRIPNVASEKINIDDLKYGTLSGSELKRVLVKEGDILVVRTNGSADLVGRCAVVSSLPEPTAFASYMILLRCDSKIIAPDYLQLMLKHLRTEGQLIDFARTTAGQYNVSLGRLRAAKIPVPPLPEQRRIVAYLDELQAKVDMLRRLQAETGAELDALMPAVLDRAFKGEL